MYVPGVPQKERPKRHVPTREYLAGLLRHPSRTLSDIALDRPLVRGWLLLPASLAIAGAGLGATGLPGLHEPLRGALLAPLFFVAGGLIIIGALTLVFFGMGRSLEGEGSLVEFATAIAFSFLPLAALGPVALLRLAPGGWGGFLFFLGWASVAGWTLRLVYLAIREAHRFTGTQSVLTLMTPFTIAFVVSLFGMVVTAMALLVIG